MKKSGPIRFSLRKQFLRIMKIYLVLLITSLAKLVANDVHAQTITLKTEVTELKNILDKIEQKSGYHFFYNNSLVNVARKTSIDVKRQEINNVLASLLSNMDLDYKMFKNQIVLFQKNNASIKELLKEFEQQARREQSRVATDSEITSIIAEATQQTPVKGVVTDEGQLPLPGVSIVIKGTTRGTQTDFDGNYQIVAEEGDVLVFSYIGMETRNVKVGQNKTINITLSESSSELDEVIVVAYGTAKKADYTGAATQINADALEKRSITNLSGAIEGSSAGVAVTASSGQPGSGQEIRIRGIGSFSASSAPLYVVDGIPFNGFINSINPNDIESITILKDASSTALYGNKAANGVVMVTTKSGKNRKGQFSFNVSNSVVNRSIPEYDRLKPNQYYEIMWEALRNTEAIPGLDSEADVAAANSFASQNIYGELLSNPYNVANDEIVGTNGKINPNARLIYDDLDWEDELVRVGYRQNYDMSYTGGSESMDYYVSLGYLTEDGYIRKSDFSRLSGRANVNYKANSWLKTGLNLGVSSSYGNQAQATSSQSSSFVNPIRFTRNIGPIYNIYQHTPDGGYVLDENGKRMYDLDVIRPSGASNGRHVLAEIDLNDDIDEITSLSAKTYVDIQLLKDLSFRTNVSMDQRHFYNTDFENRFVGDGATAGRSGRTYTRRTTVGFNQLLNYSKSFGDHNLRGLLGHESLRMRYNNFNGSRQGVIADGNSELSNFVTTLRLNSYEDSQADESYFGSVNYNYDGKYFLSGSYRQDGSSKFYKDTRWGEFWSFGTAWRLDREKLFRDQTWIDMLKLRGSYGEIGNNSGIGYYAYQGLYDLGYNNQSEAGVLQASLENKDLFWETSVSYDVALEFRLFNRISGVVEYYNKESDNLLFNVPLPLSSGVSDITRNIGAMYNRGIELSLNFDVVRNENFQWDFGFNMATLENRFTRLPQDEIINGSKKLMVGRSIYDYWLRNWYGVDPADGVALYYANEEAIESDGDDIRVIDGNTLTTKQGNAEYHYAGTAIPDLTGAISNSFSYKGFNLGFLFTYQLGGESIDYNYQGVMSSGSYGSALSVDILKRWQKPGDITDVPRMDPRNTSDFNATSDRWLVDSSYLNLRQASLSYNLPQDLIERLDVASAQFFVNAENVFSINARKGLNVQQNFSGTTSNVYTPSRVVSLGLKLKF